MNERTDTTDPYFIPRKTVDQTRLTQTLRTVLEILGCDLANEHMMRSPERMAETLIELTNGLDAYPEDISKLQTTFAKACTAPGGTCSNVVTAACKVRSICAHHFLPFVGKAIISYIPGKVNCGASKMQRIVDFCSARPTGQEQLAHDIIRVFTAIVEPRGVATWIGGVHFCMVMRGVREDGWLENRHMTGEFLKNPGLADQFSEIVARLGKFSIGT